MSWRKGTTPALPDMGFRYYLPVKRALRDAAGLAAGDAVVVEQAVRMLHDGRRHP